MRVLQTAVPAARLHSGIGSTLVDTLSYFSTIAVVMPPLITDGASEGLFSRAPAQTNQPIVSTITNEAGLMLFAKDMDTLRRGLSAYPRDVGVRSADSGLGLIVGKFRREGSGLAVNFMKWGIENRKQHFLHATFRISAWLVKHGTKPWERKAAHRQLNEMGTSMGMDYIITFKDFCQHYKPDEKLMRRASFIFIIRTADIAPDFSPPGCTVVRYIANSLQLADLATHAVSRKS
ncbi:hypothetical protein [Falsiroseomonas sp. E2-1-a20]|uniref:hypothetical protein n=1 Tax=Falsiroseomonas sp. E2-1-a20 TaxID=3239300 RepID=UPI003F3CF466